MLLALLPFRPALFHPGQCVTRTPRRKRRRAILTLLHGSQGEHRNPETQTFRKPRLSPARQNLRVFVCLRSLHPLYRVSVPRSAPRPVSLAASILELWKLRYRSRLYERLRGNGRVYPERPAGAPFGFFRPLNSVSRSFTHRRRWSRFTLFGREDIQRQLALSQNAERANSGPRISRAS